MNIYAGGPFCWILKSYGHIDDIAFCPSASVKGLQKYLHFWNQCDLLVATCGLFGINLSLLSWPQLPMGNLVYSKQFDRGGSSSSQQTTLLTTRRRGHCSVYPLSALSRRMENDTGPLSFNAKESSEWQVRLFCDAQTLLL